MIDPAARVHPLALLEDGVTVGARTAVWQRAQIRRGASIGADCIIGRDAFIDEQVTIGDRVKIQNAALVYRGVTVDDAVFIGPNAILTNDRYPRAITATGSIATAADWEVGAIHLGTGSSVGAGAVVVAGVEIGGFAMVGAGAVVTRDVAHHSLVVGNPARRLGWVCDCGRRLLDPSDRPAQPEPSAAALHCASCGRRFEYLPDRDALAAAESAP